MNQKLDKFSQTIITRLEETCPQALQRATHLLGELTLVVDRASLVEVCTSLRDDPALAFNMCDLSAVDVWPQRPRFQVNVHLLSIPAGKRLRVKVCLEERMAYAPTLSGVWPCAAWYERETHELFGITFQRHPDPRPLLLPDDWDHAPPLRRDVSMPVEEVAFSFSQERIYRDKPFAQE